jgi:glycosyltransferase involved in cell wall biosynthesis
MPRRAAAYRRVVVAARGVACCSEHEASLLREHVHPAARAAVVPHAVTPLPLAERPAPDGSVALLGFVYPGKGHREVIDAVAALQDPPPVVALGKASAGHEADVDALRRHAEDVGVDFAVTGYLGDDQLLHRLRSASVPVAAHRHVSASGSIATWIAAGRRPLVADGRYTREVDALRPGCVTRFTDLADAIRDAGDTWLAPDADTGPDDAAMAAMYRDFWAGVAW